LAADAVLRDRLFRALDREGLGVSKMYPVTLPHIRGLENQLHTKGESYPNAEAFARRILTLPIHSQVRELDLQRMHACIRAVIGR
jgi:dTDP-4-amino-4,6-dideoxygalactose transaminase